MLGLAIPARAMPPRNNAWRLDYLDMLLLRVHPFVVATTKIVGDVVEIETPVQF
jgi:hypothetical protein